MNPTPEQRELLAAISADLRKISRPALTPAELEALTERLRKGPPKARKRKPRKKQPTPRTDPQPRGAARTLHRAAACWQ